MLNKPVLNATATESPVRINGVARNNTFPIFVLLKPKVIFQLVSLPVLNTPIKINLNPSHTALREIFPPEVMEIISKIKPPNKIPTKIEISEDIIDLVAGL